MSDADVSAVRLVCFDLGRVLVRLRDDLVDACGAAGVDVPGHAGDEQVRAVFMALLDEHERGRVGREEFVGRFAELMGVRPAQAEAVWQAWLAGCFEGACELVEELGRVKGVGVACLSNTSELHWEMMAGGNGGLNALPVDGLDFCFASHLIGWRKPEAEIYAHVERTTGVEPGGILFFDDRQDNVQAAVERGWLGELVGRSENPVPGLRRVLSERGVL